MQTLGELFREEEDRMAVQYEADKASGKLDQEAKERSVKFQEEMERLERNGCIIHESDDEGEDFV